MKKIIILILFGYITISMPVVANENDGYDSNTGEYYPENDDNPVRSTLIEAERYMDDNSASENVPSIQDRIINELNETLGGDSKSQ